MSSLLTFAFWFNLRPGSMSGLSRNILIGFIILLIVAAVLLFIAKVKKGAYRNIFASFYNFCIFNALIALMLLFFNYELVPFFSAHFWFLLWAIIIIWWIIALVIKIKKVMMKKKEQTTVDEIKKYLP